VNVRFHLLFSCCLLVACPGSPASESPASASPVPAPSATDRAAASTPAPSAAAPSSAVPTAAPSASAVASAAADEPMPDVEVKNIGMHIGGGPNDNETKAPIKTSVEPHFDALKRCYAKAEEQKQGDVSLDLKIDKAGGKAELQKYKSGIPGDAFKSCVSDLFKEIEFKKPKTGTTIVSYSLRFTPGKKK
jgi:hypothetical protein